MMRPAVSRLSSQIARFSSDRPRRRHSVVALAIVTSGLAGLSIQDSDRTAILSPRSKLTISSRWNLSTTACETLHAGDDHIPHGYSEPDAFNQCVEYHRSLLPEYRHRWSYDNPESRIPTSTAWPRNVPSAGDVPALEQDLIYCKRSPNYRNDESYCDDLQFRIAAYYVQQLDAPEQQQKGFKLVKDLAERGHPDAMCYYGMILNEGRVPSIDANPQMATVWWRRCVDMHNHIPSVYELAVALYTGEGVAENEDLAFHFFRMAADTGHAGASYMLGDCLLDGIGCERDRAEALDWLVTAAELGHRGARSRVMAVLEKQEGVDYGKFTDASRQTLVADLKERKQQEMEKWTGEDENDSSKRTVSIERRFTIGGGSGNPVVLAKRKTVVEESRDS